jgi:hypothetical protein
VVSQLTDSLRQISATLGRGENIGVVSVGSCIIGQMLDCPSSDNLGHLSVVSFGGSGSSLIEFMRFQFGGASAA